MKPKIYLANCMGFNAIGRDVMNNKIIPRLEEMGIEVLEPFREGLKNLDMEKPGKMENVKEKEKLEMELSREIPKLNDSLMLKSDALLPVLDGPEGVDDGIASEIGFFAGINNGKKPIIAVRSDFRMGENTAVPINPQMIGYIEMCRGILVCSNKIIDFSDGFREKGLEDKDPLEAWFGEIEKWCRAFREV